MINSLIAVQWLAPMVVMQSLSTSFDTVFEKDNATGLVSLTVLTPTVLELMFAIDIVGLALYVSISLGCYLMIFKALATSPQLKKKTEVRLALMALIYVTNLTILTMFMIFMLINGDLNRYIIVYDAIVDFSIIISPFVTITFSSIIREHFLRRSSSITPVLPVGQ